MNTILTNIDTYKCLCRQNKSFGIYTQCSKNKKEGDFCSLHSKSKEILRVDEELPDKYKKFIKLQDFMEKKQKVFNKTTILELTNTCKKYNFPSPGTKNKKELIKYCEKYFLIMEKFSDAINFNKLIVAQKQIKNYLNKKELLLRGPGFLQRKKCNNQEDFFTFEPIVEIPNKYFFSYRDEDGFIYAFDIRSFHKLVEKNMTNPYNRNNIPDGIKKNLKKLIDNPKYKLEEIKKSKVTNEQKMVQRVINVFQKIDQLETYAGGTNINWFLNLSKIQLKEYYKVLEDIWNYRSELSTQRKNMIVPNQIMFPISIGNFYKINEKTKLRKIVLKEMDKLVDSAASREDKILGSYYVLIGLVEISTEVAASLPWLIQT